MQNVSQRRKLLGRYNFRDFSGCVIHISYIQTFYIFVNTSLSVFSFSPLSCDCPSLIVQKKCDESHYYHLFNVFLKFVPYLDSGNLSPSNQAYSHNMSSGALGKGRLQSKTWMNFLKKLQTAFDHCPHPARKTMLRFFSLRKFNCFFPGNSWPNCRL